jgi:hypothetical protein
MKMFRVFASLMLAVPLYLSAQTVGTITLREAPARLIRGTTILQAAEGVRLRPGDILETSEKGFMQVELTDGRIVAVGAASRIMALGRGSQANELVLLTGWMKGESAAGPTPHVYACPRLAASSKGGAVLVHSSPDASEVYFESGPGTVSQVNSDAVKAAPMPAKAGQFFSRRPGKNVVAAPRPDANFVEGMPVPFRDTLPSRLARFSAKAVEPKVDREVNYSDIEPWLKAGIAWRRGFVERFRPRLKDPAFRKEIEAHLSSLPEWDPILHPENYEPENEPDAAKPTKPRGR